MLGPTFKLCDLKRSCDGVDQNTPMCLLLDAILQGKIASSQNTRLWLSGNEVMTLLCSIIRFVIGI